MREKSKKPLDVIGFDMAIHSNNKEAMHKEEYTESSQHGSFSNRSEYETAARNEAVCYETLKALWRRYEIIRAKYELERLKRHNERR